MNRITIMMLLALTCGGVWLPGYSSMQAAQPGPLSKDKEGDPFGKSKMFPDGVVHDFGKVQHGTQPKHAFRVVNTSTVPLRIVSVRASMSPTSAYSTTDILQPNEETKLEINVDTRRFLGSKTMAFFLLTDNGRPMETRFIIKADSQVLEPADKIDEKMFPDGLEHDFGKVQRGTQVLHAFRIVNTLNVPLHIASVRVSMGRGTSARVSKDTLQPKEEGFVHVTMDTRRFLGSATQTIIVLLDQPRLVEHRIWVQVASNENLALFPDKFDFGKITRSDTPTRRVVLSVLGQPKLQITEAKCDSKHIQVKVLELGRGATTTIYQVSATVRADIPEGELSTTVELTTNNPAMPKLFVPVRVEVELAK